MLSWEVWSCLPFCRPININLIALKAMETHTIRIETEGSKNRKHKIQSQAKKVQLSAKYKNRILMFDLVWTTKMHRKVAEEEKNWLRSPNDESRTNNIFRSLNASQCEWRTRQKKNKKRKGKNQTVRQSKLSHIFHKFVSNQNSMWLELLWP